MNKLDYYYDIRCLYFTISKNSNIFATDRRLLDYIIIRGGLNEPVTMIVGDILDAVKMSRTSLIQSMKNLQNHDILHVIKETGKYTCQINRDWIIPAPHISMNNVTEEDFELFKEFLLKVLSIPRMTHSCMRLINYFISYGKFNEFIDIPLPKKLMSIVGLDSSLYFASRKLLIKASIIELDNITKDVQKIKIIL